jgi:hypothetical protein
LPCTPRRTPRVSLENSMVTGPISTGLGLRTPQRIMTQFPLFLISAQSWIR